jgi:monofunctional biosynthetic peptidoglycan transglycosylase
VKAVARKSLRYLGWTVATVALLLVLYQAWIFTVVLWWSQFNPSSTSFMRMRLDELQEKRPEVQLRHEWVPYERISIHLKRAVITAEDDSFVDHDGFDWDGIQRAMEKNKRKGRAVSGGSTISQQLAKNLFLSPSRSYFRKAQEAAITLMIEAVWSKRRILEVYLNVVEWGNGIFGCQAASQRYYRLSADRLGPGEAARLAVMLPNPRRYENNFGPRLAAHAERIRARMIHSQVP